MGRLSIIFHSQPASAFDRIKVKGVNTGWIKIGDKLVVPFRLLINSLSNLTENFLEIIWIYETNDALK